MKLGFLSMPLAGHLNPMTALARKLQSRGHKIVFIGIPDAEPIVRAAGLNFVPFCEKEYPAGAVSNGYANLTKLSGLEVVEYSLREMHPQRCRATLEHLEDAILKSGIEAMVIDTIHFFAELVPMKMGLPYVHIWNVLFIDRTGSSPSCFFTTPVGSTPEALAKNLETARETNRILSPVAEPAKEYAAKNGLDIDWNDPYATLSKLAVITQTPREFDCTIPELPTKFVYAGPFHDDEGRAKIPFSWERLTGAPLIYASMGTLLNGMEHVYRYILEAVGRFPETQIVLSVGKNISLSDIGFIPSNVIVVPRAPQLEMLKQAVLCITHAGHNTALESLAQGVPMVAIPVGFDQPGIAARIAHHGVGEFVEVGELSTDRLADLINKVMRQPHYRENAQRFKRLIADIQGLDVAAETIEDVLKTHTWTPSRLQNVANFLSEHS
jgi:MGT family glycosyltransferase